ncbi:hypothetical protein [Methanosarcina sp. 2.H.A.1B.4]|uniref:hypothetical protein n=1 Tax=Methanosarcina sp. 2.H.A.1B.4 TaxID=1483600 RepID=UPI000AA4DBBD|nr:hypothetical protein [Methanosarcina sp. 2.H.A.1B.4]
MLSYCDNQANGKQPVKPVPEGLGVALVNRMLKGSSKSIHTGCGDELGDLLVIGWGNEPGT